jgi:tRNA dimethylallyltransferase
LYWRALLEGLADVPQRSEKLRERLRADAVAHPPGYLHRLLKHLDAEAAQKIAAADEQKLIRAIEVCLLARKPISEVHRSGRKRLEGWRVLKIGLMPPHDRLRELINARTGLMLKRGWLREVEGLRKSGLCEDVKPFDFIGYRELLAVLRGEIPLERARECIQQATRRYAKRQVTWFRKEKDVRWFSGFGDDADLEAAVVGWLKAQGLRAGRGATKRSV